MIKQHNLLLQNISASRNALKDSSVKNTILLFFTHLHVDLKHDVFSSVRGTRWILNNVILVFYAVKYFYGALQSFFKFHIYAFSRRFYPKQLTFIQAIHFFCQHVFSRNWTHNLCTANNALHTEPQEHHSL